MPPGGGGATFYDIERQTGKTDMQNVNEANLLVRAFLPQEKLLESSHVAGLQFNRIFWPPKSWPKSSPNSSPTRSRSFLGRHPSLGGVLGGLKILLNCHPPCTLLQTITGSVVLFINCAFGLRFVRNRSVAGLVVVSESSRRKAFHYS